MNMLLKQARKGLKTLVMEDPQTISVSVSPDASDPWATTTTSTFTGRIAHEQRAAVADLQAGTAGLSTNLQRFLTVDHTVDFLKLGDIITDKNGAKWKLGPIDPLEKFGGVHGYQAPLETAT